MYQDDPGLEQRLSRFEAQLDRFSLALHQWQETQDHPHPPSALDVDQRIRTIEDTLGREAQALRQLHEEPLKQLQAHAATLKDLCTVATNSVSGIDQAEARLAELQANVRLLLTDLSRSLQAIVTDLRIGAAPAVSTQSSAAAWPLERVVHLHDELRRATNGGDHSASPQDPTSPETTTAASQPYWVPRAAEAAEPPTGRIRLLEGAVAGEPEVSRDFEVRGRLPRRWYLVGVAGVVAAGLLTFGLARGIEGRLNDAAARVAAAERQVVATTQLANREVVAAREGADRQIAEARQLAQRAETVGAILAAPDLIRFNLTSAVADRSSAQVLWSRTRGLVLSGSRLPAAPPESTYQLWLVTGTQSVSAGLFVPDAAGRATLVIEVPPRVTGPVVGAAVTVEPDGGRPAPSGRTLLARFP